MVVFLYSGGQRHPLTDPQVHVGGVPVPLQTIHAYTGGQRYLVWSRTPPTLTASSDRWDRVALTWTVPGSGADSYRLYRGTTQVYSGTALAYTDTGLDPATAYSYRVEALRAGVVIGEATASRTTPALTMAPMTATAVSTSQINVSWSNPGGLTSVRLRDSVGGDQALAAGATSGTKTGLAASTSYNFAVDGVRGGQKWSNLATGSAKTQAPVYQQKSTGILSPAGAGSYFGNGNRRSTAGPYYSGNYTPGSNGRQKSAFVFAIPGDVRGCHSVDKVEVRFQNQHSYSGGGVTQHIGITHTQSLGATWPGSTGPFGGKGTAKGAWWANAAGERWVDITGLTDPYFKVSVAENFRGKGAWGITLEAPSDDINYYSYWGSAELRISYTVRVG